ncbi:MAG: single-stranded DNA-binding protein [Dermatophilaceae bacterium]|nr:single-stranded DNA-binding protein [Intrasporangiaceae bacterium]
MNENMITVSGNVIAEPEMRQTKGGPMLTFRVASNHRYFNNRSGQWEEGVTNYYDVVAFRQLAANTAESLHKGYGVFVRGQLRQRRYTRQDGSQGMSCEIAAKVVGPDLTYGVAQWMRRPKSQPADVGSGGPGRGQWADTSNDGQSDRQSSADLPDPERTAYVVARDHDPEETYDEIEVDEDGVILGDSRTAREPAVGEAEEPAA